MNEGRNRLTLNSISNYIFAIGGHGQKDSMETINLKTDRQWSKQKMPFSVSSHCTVALGNNIIVTGGENEKGRVRKIILMFKKQRNENQNQISNLKEGNDIPRIP